MVLGELLFNDNVKVYRQINIAPKNYYRKKDIVIFLLQLSTIFSRITLKVLRSRENKFLTHYSIA